MLGDESKVLGHPVDILEAKDIRDERLRKCPWKIECFLEDLFLGSQWSIILGYRRLSVKSFYKIIRMILWILQTVYPRMG